MRYIPELDGLRGFLSTLVVIAHLQAAWVIWVWGSMDVFFCMSGFLIGSVLLREQFQPGFYRRYAVRRILRIWPTYYVLVLVCLAITAARGHTTHLESWAAGIGTIKYFLFLQNTEWWFVHLDKLVSSKGTIDALGHCWSVALEEQFYILAPLLCLWFGRSRRPRLVAGAVLLAACVLGTYWRLAGISAWATLPARFDGFAAGLFLAVVLQMSRGTVTPRLQAIAWCVLAIACGILVWLYATHVGRTFEHFDAPLFSFGVSACSLLGGAVVLLIYAHRGAPLLQPLRSPALVYLGKMSYSTYLWHFALITFSTPLLDELALFSPAQKFVVQLVLCFGLANLSYRWIERPLMHYRRHTHRHRQEQGLVEHPI